MKTYSIKLGDVQTYEKFKYPAGELQVRLKPIIREEIARAESVAVMARIKTAEDIIETCLLVSAVRGVGNPSLFLVLPYLPYARADRRFVDGDCFGLEAFASILNGMNVQIVTLDAHSRQSHNLIHDLIDLSPKPLIEKTIGRILTKSGASRLTLLFPDDGARKRYSEMFAEFDLDILHCTKVRDKVTGKLSHFSVPAKEKFKTTDVLLIDDICDGGGTFIGIANGLKEHELNLSLYVSHGIFSKGLENLSSCFKTVYTTDSFEHGFEHPQLIVYLISQLFDESIARVPEPITSSL